MYTLVRIPVTFITVSILLLYATFAIAQDYTMADSDLAFEEIDSEHVSGLSAAEVWVEGDNFVSVAVVEAGQVSQFQAEGDRHWLVVAGEIMDPFGSDETLGSGSFFTNPSNNKMRIECGILADCLLHYYSRVSPLAVRNSGSGPMNQKGGIDPLRGLFS